MKNSNNGVFCILAGISIFIFFVAIASTAAFWFNRILLNKQHAIKWQDYDECGIF